MTVMVDEWRRWGTGRAPSCHLTTDNSNLGELHRFAAAIGLKRCWFQPRSSPHYDIMNEPRRRRALQQGAKFVPARIQVIARLAKRSGDG